jgi:uncharacterized membrane protein YkoI
MKKLLIIFLFLILPAHVFGKEPPKNRIPEAEARKIALKAYDGTIKSSELEYENRRWVYSYDMTDLNGKGIHEVGVDAITGKVLENKIETTAQEADEVKAEGKDKK